MVAGGEHFTSLAEVFFGRWPVYYDGNFLSQTQVESAGAVVVTGGLFHNIPFDGLAKS